jgi:dienelactone hydrolase
MMPAFADEVSPMTHASRQLGSLFLACSILVMPVSLAAQERAMVPLTIDGERVKLATITYKPPGDGPFPTLIFHHGSTGGGKDPNVFLIPDYQKPLADWFTARGWAVVLPSRRGRGGSEGLYDEGFSEDRAQGYTCDEARLLAGAARALRDVDAVTPTILALPFVDKAQVAVGGHSRGGVLAISWAAQHPDQSRAVINFVGGWRRTSCATATSVNQALFNRDASRAPPSLWLYGARDPFYPLSHSRANFAAFQAAGGRGTFYEIVPLPDRDGHQIAYVPSLWSKELTLYLTSRGLPVKGR